MKKKALFALKLVISSALIAYLFTLIDVQVLIEQLRGLKVGYVVVALSLLFMQSVLSTLKWKLILLADKIVIPYLFLLKTYLIGTFVSLFLPTSFGGDVYRVLALKGRSSDVFKNTSSVLFDRLTGLFALVSIGCLAYLSLPDMPFDYLVGLAYLAMVLGFVACTSNQAVRFVEAIKWRPVAKLALLIQSLNTYRTAGLLFVAVLAISFLFQFNIVVINKFYSLALSIDVQFALLLVIIPLVYLTEVLPISINGIGVRESAFVFFFLLIGKTSEEGLALALLVISMRYVMGLIGGTLLVVTLLKSGQEKSDLNQPAGR